MVPFEILSLATEILVCCDDAGGDAAGCEWDSVFFAPVVPMLEKFQVPEGERSSETCGSVMVKDETSSFLEKISGIIATPAVNCLACKKGVLLKAGSSAITTLSTVTPPERIERPMFPI